MITFQLLNDEIYSYTNKSHLVLWNSAKLVCYTILSFKNRKVNTFLVSVFSVDRFFRGNKRKKFKHILVPGLLSTTLSVYVWGSGVPTNGFWDYYCKKQHTLRHLTKHFRTQCISQNSKNKVNKTDLVSKTAFQGLKLKKTSIGLNGRLKIDTQWSESTLLDEKRR